MIRHVQDILGKEKALAWWTTPNPYFGNIAPCWLFYTDTESRLKDFILHALEDNNVS